MTRAALLFLILLTACTRPLAPGETEVAKALFGPSLDTTQVRVAEGLGLLPPSPPRPVREAESAAPLRAPEGICERRRSTRRSWRSPAAFVLWNTVFIDPRYYTPDSFAGFPESVPYPASVLMAHELVHVWQWQNRMRTGYTVEQSAGESVDLVDPYWFTADPDAEFLSYGYEQQGAIVQDFVCHALFDRENPKLGELAAILRPVLPVDDFLSRLGGR
jgi:hypothetical protein